VTSLSYGVSIRRGFDALRNAGEEAEMAIAPTYPGVYIEEVPSGVHTITGVSTSVAAFLGFFARGPMNKAVHIFSEADLEREFGPLIVTSEAGYGLRQFFLNGGTEAHVVRVAGGTPVGSAIALMDSSGGTSILEATALSQGTWGDGLRIDVDYATNDPGASFNLTVSEVRVVAGRSQVVAQEVFRNLVVDSASPSDAIAVVNGGSKLIKLAVVGAPAANARPAQTGTISDPLTAVPAGLAGASVDVSLNGGAATTLALPATAPTTLAGLAAMLQAEIRTQSSLSNATVALLGSASTQQFLQAKAGSSSTRDIIEFADAGANTVASDLGLDDAGRTNVQQYRLGDTAAAGAQALPDVNGTPTALAGDDGDLPDANALLGNKAGKTGLYALEDVDLFNILCIPDTMRLGDADAAAVAADAESYCEERRAFYILDIPEPATNPRDQVQEVADYLGGNGTLRHRNVALYYPRPKIADRLSGFRLRPIAPSGTMAGVYARTDSTRGVWKAPAGTEASLRGVQALEYRLTDGENGALNPLAINCFRTFPAYGNVAWGARTLDGSDQEASEWKYIPVRRTALYLEESLYRATHWVVFEPNADPLWAQIRLNIGAFLHSLFLKGAFFGTTPKEAYFVKCDRETTTQDDINRGVVNILVGFAPLKPAEFVIIQIQQIAGQIAT
jgi:phage tail sheath protein FI